MSSGSGAPHDFSDHKAHMQWKAEVAAQRAAGVNVPMIPSDFSQGSRAESSSVTAMNKLFSNPFIPIGMVATVGCLVGMLSSTLKRNPARAQLYMRGRCAAQFLTVCSLVGGAMLFGFQPALQPGQHGEPHGLKNVQTLQTNTQ